MPVSRGLMGLFVTSSDWRDLHRARINCGLAPIPRPTCHGYRSYNFQRWVLWRAFYKAWVCRRMARLPRLSANQSGPIVPVRRPAGQERHPRPVRRTASSVGVHIQRAISNMGTCWIPLTRARRGLTVFVPRGDAKDPTRPPAFYDETNAFLVSRGIPEIK